MRLKFILLLVCLIGTINAFSQSFSHEIGIESDNDSYLAHGSDRYYTNGIFIYYRHALKIKDQDKSLLQNKVLGFEAGQKLFNPQTGRIPSKMYDDRPFAAYLYVGSTLNLLYKNESNLKLGLQLGVIGPAALGEPVQNFIHSTFNFYNLNGWQYQIKNSPQLNLSAEYNKLLARSSKADVSLSSYANLGTGFNGAGLGPMFRLGNFNQLFNSISTQSTVTQKTDVVPLHKHEFFFYYKPQINYIAYDATVQGGMFQTHHNDTDGLEQTRTIEPLVFSQQFGVSYTGNHWVYDFAAIFHTKDVKEMVRRHQWGAFTVLYRFN